MVKMAWTSSCPQSDLQLVYQPEARVRNQPAYFDISFWSLGFFGLGMASLVWAKLILGRFRDAVSDFSRFPAGSGDYLNAFSRTPANGISIFH
jgi:hypothetical protein